MSTELLEKIKSRGYWHIVIRPEQFVAERIPTLAACRSIIERNQVRYRGLYLPYIDDQSIRHGLDYIEVTLSAFGSVHETWRFYQSGQFVLFRGFREDWMKENSWFPSHQRPAIEPGTKLGILSTLYQLSEIYEFAARLGQANILGNQLFLAVNLAHTKGRRLFYWGSAKFDFPPVIPPSTECEFEELLKQRSFDVVDFIARSRQYSFEHFLWLLERFNVNISRGLPDFKRDQERLFERRL
jgi:hypothetical protein